MQSIDEIAEILELMDHPAFCVTGGTITAANQAARAHLVPVGDSVAPLLASGRAEYALFTGGTMHLTLTLGGQVCSACVTKIGSHHIFRLQPDQMQPQLRALALAAQELRRPLNDMMALSRELFADPAPEASEDRAARLNRELYRMLRVVGNMSFTAAPHMEMRDVSAVLEELFEAAAHYCESAGRTLEFTNLPVSAYSCIDSDLLGRAVHNLLSNAIKFTAPGGTIRAKLTRTGNTLYLTVQDSGNGADAHIHSNAFTRLGREPGMGSAAQGLGLGLMMVDAIAKAHGGTVMLDQPPGSGVKVVLSLPIRQDGGTLRSLKLSIDYAGEHSRELIELADVLPHTLYAPDKA